MDKTRWIIFVAICVLIFGALFINKKSNDVKVENIDPGKVITANKKKADIADHKYGSDSDKVVLIEYGDFQCPGCRSLHPSLKLVKEKYKDQLTFVFRNFPLTSIHPNALAASTAAEAAGLQGKWWQYHDILYDKQDEWSAIDASKRTDVFVGYAKDLNLNTATFKKDLESQKIADKIAKDLALGKKIKASSTPTLVLNGKTLEQSQWESAEKLEDTVRTAIKNSGQTLDE